MTATEFCVSRANRKQANAIASVLRQAFADYEPLYTPEGYRATVVSARVLLDRWDEGPVWVAVQGSAVVGTVSAVRVDDGLYIRSMAVVPAAAGGGVGRKLLEQVEELAIRELRAKLLLSTTPFLDRAIGLYERFGFTKSGSGPTDLHGTPLFTMQKQLSIC